MAAHTPAAPTRFDAQISRFRLNTLPLQRSDIIAHFDCRVGDIAIHGATLRLPHDGSHAFTVLPSKGTCGISIAQPSNTRDSIYAAVVARYRAETGRWP